VTATHRTPPAAPRHLERLERWLTWRPSRVLIGLGFVAVMSAFGAAQAHDSFQQRFGEMPAELRDEFDIHFGWLHSFARFGLYWGIWGAGAIAIVPLGLWLAARLRSWLLFLALQLPLSFLAGWGVGALHDYGVDTLLGASPESLAMRAFFESRRFPRGRGERRDGETQDGAARAAGDGQDGPPRDAEQGAPERGSDERRGDPRRGDGRRSGRGTFRPEESPLGGAPRGLFAYWFVLALGAGAHLFLRGRQEERRAAELGLAASHLQTELATARLSSLKSQLHPHFLFNALHSVGGLIRAGEKTGALTALANIGDLLRKTLELGDEPELSLEEELRLALRYLDVEAARLGDRLRTVVDVPDDLKSATVPALLLLPLVENAVRHGIAPRAAGGTLSIRARAVGQRLEIAIEDDGVGFDAGGEAPTHGNGIGLSNTRARLAALYDGDAELRVERPAGGGARVVASLPLELDA
jgi:two-component sensor histidine kinase